MLSLCGAEVVETSWYQFEPEDTSGYTFLALLTTSHFSIHTWPEYGSAAIDAFTCGDLVDLGRIEEELKKYFAPATQTSKLVLR